LLVVVEAQKNNTSIWCAGYPQFLVAGELWFTYTITMTQGDLITTIQEELQILNREIDYKIIKGFDYHTEAKRHKFLLRQLHNLTRTYQSTGWLQRASSLVSTFIF